jgi:toxin ParE1/3/4
MSRRTIKPHVVEQDLEEIANYIAKDSYPASLRFVTAAEETFKKLLEAPGLGGSWESLDERLANLRVWPVKGFENYLIFYRPREDGIALVRVLHGGRDIESILKA